jgi:hypothetical protein
VTSRAKALRTALYPNCAQIDDLKTRIIDKHRQIMIAYLRIIQARTMWKDKPSRRRLPWPKSEPRPGSREHAIAVYRRTILEANERGAEGNDPDLVRRVKRRLAQSDLFFLLVYVLKRVDLNRDWYFERCREVQAAPNGYLDLWAVSTGRVR